MSTMTKSDLVVKLNNNSPFAAYPLEDGIQVDPPFSMVDRADVECIAELIGALSGWTEYTIENTPGGYVIHLKEV